MPSENDTRPRVAVASRSFSRNEYLRGLLLDRYGKATFNDAGKSLAGDELIAFLSGHELAITALERIDEPLLAQLPELRVIGKYGVGTDMLDLDAIEKRGIRLGWTPGVNKRSVSELVIAFAISLLRHVPEANAEVRGGGWRQIQGRELTGRTVGIIGCGHVGTDVLTLMRAFACNILFHDIRRMPRVERTTGARQVSLETLLAESEVVTIHLPRDASTEYLLNAERLALMRSDAVLINLARGGLIDEQAVARMLHEDRLAGAAFDVFAEEPPTSPQLLTHPRFLATPHIGGSSQEAVAAMGESAIQGLENARLPSEIAELWPRRPTTLL